MSPRSKIALALTLFTGLLATALLLLGGPALASDPQAGAAARAVGDSNGLGYIAAALATGLSSLGAGLAVAHVGAAAIGAITEKPELLGRMLILVGLAEGIAIYGLIVSILILNRLG
ncbi:ATP synthase subunit C [Candidatus Magnetaquicoccus inordinatus]|uniref:ATP synthase subunit C n=1 Tax=Candidatus Magnetaquicoccus inordinatus TaxID=2496818 RepID=UPI00102ADCB3|nr:ATP synthase subunit C [Candidatus Magnetaquicoccus inordinatus]